MLAEKTHTHTPESTNLDLNSRCRKHLQLYVCFSFASIRFSWHFIAFRYIVFFPDVPHSFYLLLWKNFKKDNQIRLIASLEQFYRRIHSQSSKKFNHTATAVKHTKAGEQWQRGKLNSIEMKTEKHFSIRNARDQNSRKLKIVEVQKRKYEKNTNREPGKFFMVNKQCIHKTIHTYTKFLDSEQPAAVTECRFFTEKERTRNCRILYLSLSNQWCGAYKITPFFGFHFSNSPPLPAHNASFTILNFKKIFIFCLAAISRSPLFFPYSSLVAKSNNKAAPRKNHEKTKYNRNAWQRMDKRKYCTCTHRFAQ